MNLFEIPQNLPAEEWSQALLTNKHVRVERIISTGQCSPEGFWYDQDENEYIVLLEGSAELTFSDGSVCPLSAGDCMLLPAHRRHRVSKTSAQPPCIWFCVFYPNE